MVKLTKYHTDQLVSLIKMDLRDAANAALVPHVKKFEKEVNAAWSKFHNSKDHKVLIAYKGGISVSNFLKIKYPALYPGIGERSYRKSCGGSDIRKITVKNGDPETRYYYEGGAYCLPKDEIIRNEIARQSLLTADESKLINSVTVKLLESIK